MKLLIDAGNTRLKWALLDAGKLMALPTLYCAELATLGEHCARLPTVSGVWVSNVAGERVAQQIVAACAGRGWAVHFIAASASQCGVRNAYHVPGQLGSDRWAALLAAWQRVGRAALVVNCGTATTIDALSAQGEFLGGLIVPGITLMGESLAGKAAQLQSGMGNYVAFPLNTADALWSGAVQATCGAIQRQYALLADEYAPLLLSGGAAQAIQQQLDLPVQVVEDLVLQGLKIIAEQERK